MGINATDSIQTGKTNDVELTKKQKRAAKKLEKARLQDEADTLIRSIAGHAKSKESKEIREYVLEQLEKMYDDGKGSITKEKYEAAEKAAKKGNLFSRIGRFFSGKEKQSNVLFKNKSYENNLEEHKKVIYSTIKDGQNTGLEILDIDKDIADKLAKSKLTADDIYQVVGSYAGDAIVSYSNKNRQPGELQFMLRELNKNEHGVVFTEKDAKKILDASGFHIEKSTDPAITARDTGLGTALGTATTLGPVIGFLGGKATQIQHNQASDGNWQVQRQSAPYNDGLGLASSLTGVGVGAVSGFLLSRSRQKDRTEYKAVPTGMPDDVKTLADYKKFLGDVGTAKGGQGANLGIKIAEHYTKKDGTLMKDELIAILKERAGSSKMEDASVLNFDEALILLTDLDSGKIKVKKEEVKPPAPVQKKEPVKEDCTVEVKKYDVIINDTECHKVKSGDNWDAIVRGLYSPKSEADVRTIRTQLKKAYLEEMQKQGKLQGVKVTDAFFPKVGEDLCLPKKININGNEYDFKTNGKVESGELKKDANGNLVKDYGVSFSTDATVNPFLKKEKKVNVDACGNPIAKGVAPEEAEKIVNQFKEQNKDKKNITVVGL